MSPKRRSLLGFYVGKEFPITWLLAVIFLVSGFLLSQHWQIQTNKRVNEEQDAKIQAIEQQMEADRKTNQEIRDSVMAFNGKIDTLNVKIDGLRTMISVGSIKAEVRDR